MIDRALREALEELDGIDEAAVIAAKLKIEEARLKLKELESSLPYETTGNIELGEVE